VSTVDDNISQAIIIKDDILDVDRLGEYHLSIGIGNNELEIGIVDSKNHRCLLFELHSFRSNMNLADFLAELDSFFDNHHLLSAGFWNSVSVFFKNQHFTLIPEEFFSKSKGEDWLCMAAGLIDNPEECHHYHHQSLGIVMDYAVPEELVKWFRKKYPLIDIKFLHQASVLLEGFNRQKPSGKNNIAFAHVDGPYLVLAIFKGKKLLMLNRFRCYDPRDFPRFTMMAFEQFGLNPEGDQLTIYGNFGPGAPLMDQYSRFFRHITFGKRPWKLYFGYMFDDLEEHKYFETFSAWFCIN
jgi:hypothetical protein